MDPPQVIPVQNIQLGFNFNTKTQTYVSFHNQRDLSSVQELEIRAEERDLRSETTEDSEYGIRVIKLAYEPNPV